MSVAADNVPKVFKLSTLRPGTIDGGGRDGRDACGAAVVESSTGPVPVLRVQLSRAGQALRAVRVRNCAP